jgi:hypothetical protein
MPLTQPRSPAEAAIAQAEARYQAGAYADAAAILGPLAGQSSGHPAAIRLLGLCRLKLDDPSGGLALLERARASPLTIRSPSCITVSACTPPGATRRPPLSSGTARRCCRTTPRRR